MLLLLLFVVVLTAIVGLFGPVSGSKDRLLSKDFWIHKTHSTRRYSLVVAGDSRIYRGVSPREMEKVLEGYRGFNAGYSSAGFAKPMFEKIERHIDFEADKPVVVLGVSPWSMTPGAGANKHLLGELGRKREEVLQSQYFSFVNSVFAPYTLKELYDYLQSGGSELLISYRYSSRGWVASHTQHPNPQKALSHVEADYINNQLSKEQLQQLAQKIREWKQQGVEVFAFRPPSTRTMEMMEDSLSGYSEKQVARVLEDAGAVWFDFDVDNYFSYDGSHLDEVSAIRLSNDLALKIKAAIRNNQ